MASDGNFYLQCDDGPNGFGQVVPFKVYRETTINRRSILALWVPIEALSPPHIIAHSPPNDPVWYERAAPEIYRIPLVAGQVAEFEDNTVIVSEAAVRLVEYSVIADATDPAKIGACLNEEQTTEIFKFEGNAPSEIISFWKGHQNTDRFNTQQIQPVTLNDE